MRFRVSPSSAKLQIEENVDGKVVVKQAGDYTVAESMDHFALTRSTSLFTATNPREENGLLYVDFNFDQAVFDDDDLAGYTLALRLNDVHNEGRGVYSDYITFKTQPSTLDELGLYIQKDNDLLPDLLSDKKIEWKNGSTLDLSAWVVVAAKVNGESERKALKDDCGFEPVIEITLDRIINNDGAELDKNFITVNGLTLTFNEEGGPTYQTLNAEATFTVRVKVNGKLVCKETMMVTITDFESTKEVAGLLEDVDAVSPFVVDFIGNEVNVGLKFNQAIKNEVETFFGKDIENVTGNEEETDGIKVTVKDATGADASDKFSITTPNKLPAITVNANAKAGVYTFEVTWIDGKKKAITEFELTVQTPTVTKVPSYWIEGTDITLVRFGDNGLVSDLDNIFKLPENTTIKFAETTTSTGKIKIDDENVISLYRDEDKDENKELEMNGNKEYAVSYQLIGANDVVLETKTITVRFYNPIVSKAFKTTTIDIFDGTNVTIDMTQLGVDLKVLDRKDGQRKYIIRGSEILPQEGVELESDELDASVYGVENIKFETIEGENPNLKVTDGTKVTWENSATLASDVTVKVKLIIENTWETIEEIITVNVKANN